MEQAEIRCTLASGSTVTFGIDNTSSADVVPETTIYEIFVKAAGA